MLFWSYMLVCVLLVPFMMIIFGRIFQKGSVKDVNYVFGYRTAMSTSSKEAWKFAHSYIGKFWLILGIILLIPSVIIMIFVIGLSKDAIGYTGMAIIFTQMFIAIIPTIPTEIALRKNFDKNGNKKQ